MLLRVEYVLRFLVQFFAEAGFPCPRKRNPSDHFLRCINSDFDVVNATLKGSQRIHVCILLFLRSNFIFMTTLNHMDLFLSIFPSY